METTRKKIIPLIILLSIYSISLFFDNRIINISTTHLFLFSTLVLCLCISLFFYEIQYLGFPQLRVFIISLSLFLLFLFVSSNINDRFVLAIEDIILYCTVFIFSYLVYICFQLFETEKLMYYISFVVTVTCTLISLLGIFEFFNVNLLNFQPNLRPGSTLSIRNFASEYSVIALPFVLILVLKKNTTAIKIFSAIASIIILVFIFFCRTRSSFAAILFYLIIVTIYFFYFKLFFEKNLRLIYISILIIMVLSFLIGTFSAPNIDKERASLNNTVSSIFDYNRPENSSRINYWKTSLRIFRDVPFTGIGAGSWFGIYPKYNGNRFNDETILNTPELNPHNDYLEILCENGVFGFMFYILFLMLIGKYLYDESKKKLLNLPVFLSFMGFLLISMISFPKNNISIMILISTSIGISLKGKEPDVKDEFLRINIKNIKLALFSSLSLILLVILLFCLFRYHYEKIYVNAIENKFEGNYSGLVEKINNINYVVYPVDANRMPVEYYKGIGYFELKNYSEALNSYNRALELTPYVPAIISNKASTLYMLKEYEDAAKLLLDLKRKCPFLIESQINLLAIYTNTGQDSLANILIKDIENTSSDSTFIKNFDVLGKIKDYYNEKNSH